MIVLVAETWVILRKLRLMVKKMAENLHFSSESSTFAAAIIKIDMWIGI